MAKILLVDDSALMRQLANGYLKKFGHEIVEASTGQAALNSIKTRTPDIVLLDINLPDISGFEVCKALRQEGHAFPVLIMSSSEGYSPWVHQLAQGFLFKPYSETVLRSKVDSLLGAKTAEPLVSTSAWNSPETFLHNLRSGIGSLPGLIEFFSTRKDNRELEEKTLRLVTHAVQEGVKLVDAYAEILRPLVLEKTLVQIDSYLKQVVASHSISHNPKISIRWELAASNIPLLSLDQKWMKRALDEIINNAQEAMDAGGTLNIGLYLDPLHDSVYISIQDHGHGLAPYAQEHCFESFFTLKKDHAGLGLSWAEKIALTHGGGINISSSENAGACAIIRLPNQPAKKPSTQTASQKI